MRILLYITGIFSLLGFFSACQKPVGQYFSGNVREAGSGRPLEGTTVMLKYWTKNKSNVTYLKTFTDQNGNFTFNHQKQNSNYYFLIADDGEHFGEIREAFNAPSNNFSLHGFAYFTTRIIKTTNTQSELSFRSDSLNFLLRKTEPYDTVCRIVIVRANDYLKFNWTVDDKSQAQSPQNPSTLSTSVMVDLGDTLVYKIKYD